MTWAVQFVCSSQRDGQFSIYDLMENLEELPAKAKQHEAREIHVVRANVGSAAEALFKSSYGRAT